MAGPKTIAPGLHLLALGGANAYLVEDGARLILVDAGFPDKAPVVLDALRRLGKAPGDLAHIVLTHAHYDHIGSLAALQEATGAETWIHGADAAIAVAGGPFRRLTPARGLLRPLLCKVFDKPGQRVAPARIDHRLSGGEVLPFAGGLRVIRTPGHCAGQVALLCEPRGVLFAGDACINIFGLGPPIGWENERQGYASLQKLAGLSYDIACFGHGKPLLRDASRRMQTAFG